MPVQLSRAINLKCISLLSTIGLLGLVVAAILASKPMAHNQGKVNDERKENSLLAKSPLRHLEFTEPGTRENSAPDYYDKLPALETIISQYKNLELVEIDQKIREIDEDLANKELIEKANAKVLDEAGYRELARLMQLSDALYNIKIERQLSALELELTKKKKGA